MALFHAVREREGDLAMMRMLGARRRAAWARWWPWKPCGWPCWGAALGLALGHAFAALLGQALAAERSLAITRLVVVT